MHAGFPVRSLILEARCRLGILRRRLGCALMYKQLVPPDATSRHGSRPSAVLRPTSSTKAALEITVDYLVGRSVGNQLTVIHPKDAVAQRSH